MIKPRIGREICYLLLAVFVLIAGFGLGRVVQSFILHLYY